MSVLFLVALQQAHFMVGYGFFAPLLAHLLGLAYGTGWGWDDDYTQMAGCASAPHHNGGCIYCRYDVVCSS
jgi:hypothetical protein